MVKDIVPGCDAAVVIGSRLREVDAKRRGLALPEQLIHVDWDERWISKNYLAALPLVGDIGAIARALRTQLEGEPYTGPRQERTAAWRRQADAEIERLSRERPEIQSLQAIRTVLPETAPSWSITPSLAIGPSIFIRPIRRMGSSGPKAPACSASVFQRHRRQDSAA